MRLAEPVGQHAVFGHAHQHAGRPDHGSVDGAGENQKSNEHHEDAEDDAPEHGSYHVHGEPGDQVVLVDVGALPCGNEHGSQQRGAAGKDQAIDGDDDGRALQVFELGMLDLAIDLGQALLAAHGQHGVAEGHENAEQSQQRQASAFQKAQRLVTEVEVSGNRRRRQVRALHDHRENAPRQKDDHHHGCDLHDAQSLAAGLFNALDVCPPVIDCDHRREDRCGMVHIELEWIVLRIHQSGREPVPLIGDRHQLVHQAGNV